MDQSEIKEQAELFYKDIRNAEKGLEKLREICQHPNTFEGDYSYRVGATMPAKICSDCGKVVAHIDNSYIIH